VASFSRALVEGQSARQSDAEFNAMLDAAIGSIFEASQHVSVVKLAPSILAADFGALGQQVSEAEHA